MLCALPPPPGPLQPSSPPASRPAGWPLTQRLRQLRRAGPLVHRHFKGRRAAHHRQRPRQLRLLVSLGLGLVLGRSCAACVKGRRRGARRQAKDTAARERRASKLRQCVCACRSTEAIRERRHRQEQYKLMHKVPVPLPAKGSGC